MAIKIVDVANRLEKNHSPKNIRLVFRLVYSPKLNFIQSASDWGGELCVYVYVYIYVDQFRTSQSLPYTKTLKKSKMKFKLENEINYI